MKPNRVMMLAVAGAMSLVACSSDSKSAGTTTSSAATTIKVVSTPTRGDVLVDGAGKTLYLFEKDSGTTSACTGGCAAVWPILSAGTVTASTGVDAGKLGSAHGQVTYNGHLLYYFSGDAAPGDMKGVDIEEWYPVTPDGGSAEAK